MRLFVCGLLLGALAFAQTRKVTDEEVMRVHRSALLIDTHNDVTSFTLDDKYDIGPRSITNSVQTRKTVLCCVATCREPRDLPP